MSSASSSLARVSDLPLVPCEYCKATVREFISSKPQSKGKKFYRCMAMDKDTGEQCSFFRWQGDYAYWLIKNGYFIEASAAPAAAALDGQKEWIEASLDEQKACIEEIKGHMSQLQDAMQEMVHVLRLIKSINDDVVELKAKPRNRNVSSPCVAVIIFFVAMICFMKLL